MIKAHQAVAQALADSGVTRMFGLIGDGNMYFVADFMKDERTSYVGAIIEGAAVNMADGYSRVSGEVGVVSVTHGPGAANTVNALIEAVRANSKVLLITASVPAKRGHTQDIDLAALFHATGADYHRVVSPAHVVDDVAMVLARVASTRRPLVLDIPMEIQEQEIEYARSRTTVARTTSVSPDAESLEAAMGIIASARRPLILAGRGAVESGARDSLIELADLLGAPLATTASGKDLFAGHPYNLGIMGSYGFPWAVDVMVKSDCIVAFGAQLGAQTTVDGELLAGRRIVQCDVAPGRMGRLYPVDVALTGDARSTSLAMVELLRSIDFEPGGFARTQLGEGVLDRDPRAEFTDRSTESTVDMRTAMIVLDEFLPTRRTVVTDAGRFMAVPWRFLTVHDAKNFMQSAWASIGLGIPTALGAALGDPESLAVAVVGDGGGMMSLTEVATAVSNDIPCVIVVLNDAAFGVEYGKFAKKGYDPELCYLTLPEFADVARGLGADAATVKSVADLEDLKPRLQNVQRPLVIDIKCDPRIDHREFS